MEPIAEPPSVPAPLAISITTPRGQAPVYAVNDVLEMTVNASQDSYVYCYYRDDEAQIARIFPNRFRPDPYVIAGRPVPVLAKGSPFGIRFETAGSREEILCIASRKELGLQLPEALKTADLTPIAVKSLEEIVAAFTRADQSDPAQARLPISVVAAN